jgi:response regulator NasT
LRIVIADDEPIVLQYYQFLLSQLGHQVVAAAQTGRELITLCREQQPDLVLTDIRMPELDGIEASAQLYRERPVPVVVVSSYREPDDVQRAQGGHVLVYLVKPVSETNLEPALAIALARFEELQALQREMADLRSRLQHEDREPMDCKAQSSSA